MAVAFSPAMTVTGVLISCGPSMSHCLLTVTLPQSVLAFSSPQANSSSQVTFLSPYVPFLVQEKQPHSPASLVWRVHATTVFSCQC